VARPIEVSDTVRTPVAEAPPPAVEAAAAAPTGVGPRAQSSAARTLPRNTQSSAPPASAPTDPAEDRRAITAAVETVERAYASALVSRVKAMLPGMSSSSETFWRNYFKEREKGFDAEFKVEKINVEGNRATVDITARFMYDRNGRPTRSADLPLKGTLSRSGSGWVWRALEGG
jgi:hypothetical protein